ncbi:MAG TPA: MBL fold metallo-hydrolase [Candidatus Dormibacteraeota bacterium]|nr:MBL fold metallo-hydrolase [Candidatus Dormibacteraeota bacterium]
MPWQEVGDRVYRHRYNSFDLNVGAVVGDDQVLVIDTRGWRAQAEELRRDLRLLSPLPWRQVVNTHAHFDHCFGNELFRGAAIWGHERCADDLRTLGEEQRANMMAGLPELADDLAQVEIVPPDNLVNERATLSVGGRKVELRYLGRGHTDNDLVVLVPDAGVVFAGDLVEEGAPPSYADSWPLEWPATVDRLLAIAPATVVPGHGDVIDHTFVRRQREELQAMAELCRQVARGELAPQMGLARAPFAEREARLALERARITWLQQEEAGLPGQTGILVRYPISGRIAPSR